MQKIYVILICLSLIFIFVGCSSFKNESKSISTATGQSSVDEKKETDINNTNSVQSPADSSNNEQAVKDEKNNVSQNKNEVIGKVKLYDGIYFDDRRFGDNILKNYCEVEIFNITDTSFDFTIYEVNESDGEKNRKVIFLTNKAVFIGDGMTAAFYGNKYTLDFTFPNKHNAEPIVTDIEISGFEPLEGKTYVNNGIPGHEFG